MGFKMINDNLNFLRTSNDIKELCAALVKAQNDMGPAIKDSVNPHFKSTYADFASVWQAAKTSLTKNGLSVVQGLKRTELEWVCITRLMHTTGQFIETDYPVVVSGAGPQPFKSATTYARRAGLELTMTIASEDDDANAAQSIFDNKAQTTNKPINKPPSNLNDKERFSSPSEFIIPFGKKYLGKKLKDIPKNDLQIFYQL
jgi:hypothetical protein